MLVFSFFRKTIEHLAGASQASTIGGQPLRVSILYGPTPEEERHRSSQAFRDEPGPHVVLASEIAAEGLDFEFVERDGQLRPAVEPDARRAANRPTRPLRAAGRDDPHHQLLGRGHDRGAHPRAALHADRHLRGAIGDLESILGDEIETSDPGAPPAGPHSGRGRGRIIDQAAENIVRRKEEDESFEQESQALLGQDDVFAEQLSQHRARPALRRAGRDRNFVAVALEARYPADQDRTGRRPGPRSRVPTDGALRDLMSNYLQRQARPRRAEGLARGRAGTTRGGMDGHIRPGGREASARPRLRHAPASAGRRVARRRARRRAADGRPARRDPTSVDARRVRLLPLPPRRQQLPLGSRVSTRSSFGSRRRCRRVGVAAAPHA